MRKSAVNLYVFCIAVIITLLFCEAVFRYLIPPPYSVSSIEFYSGMSRSDNELGHALKPNIKTKHFNTNSYGFRSPELKAGRMNIFCIGDSHTFGWGVYDEFTYPRQLQDLVGDKYNVVNMGAGGYNIASELGILNRYIGALNPKVVIFGVVVDDVLKGVHCGFAGGVHEPNLDRMTKLKSALISYFRQAKRNSALVTYIKDVLPGIQIKLGLRKPAHEEYFEYWNNSEFFDFYKNEIKAELTELSKSHIKAIFVIFPFPSQVYLMDKTERPNVALFRSLEGGDVTCIDLLPVFQANYKKISTLYLKDGHPNEYAYKLVAREIFKKLNEENFIDVKDN